MKILISSLSVLFIMGCNLISQQPYINTVYFDLGAPEKLEEKKNWNLDVANFETSGPYQTRMVFRREPNIIEFDEFNRWSIPPAEMMKRYLLIAYKSENGIFPNVVEKYLLKGVLVQLEANLQKKTINIIIHIAIVETKSGKEIFTKTFTEKVPVKKITGAAFAKATKDTLNKIITKISPNIPK